MSDDHESDTIAVLAKAIQERSAMNGAEPKPCPALKLDDTGIFVNRELSLLAFQKRVLEEARDPANPLLERLAFFSIFGSNIDEFFMVRVALLKQRVTSNVQEISVDGLTGTELLAAIRADIIRLNEQAYACLKD
jgi:polyphosphate kinase